LITDTKIFLKFVVQCNKPL